VQWFQIKHNLRPSGVVDAATLALLRLRSRGSLPAAMPTTAPAQPAAPAAPAPAPTRAPAPAAPPRAHGSGGSAAPVVIVAALALLALLAAFLLFRRRRREAVPEPPEPPAPPPAIPSQPADAKHAIARRPSQRVVAYTTGRNPRELRRQAEEIERACSERGWALAQVVRERGNGNGQRPGLKFALKQLADGGGSRLVACRVGDVGRTPTELAALLGWCARTGVDLVALDVGLDTGTRNGKLIARSLVAPGKRARVGRTLRRRRGKAPGVDGELASSSSP
jgi:MYXO-CTERM domain-containing protein